MYFAFCSSDATAISMCRFGESGGKMKGVTVLFSFS